MPAHPASLIHGLPSQHRRHRFGSGTLPAGRRRDTFCPSPSSPGPSPAVTVRPRARCLGRRRSCLLRERLSSAVLPSRSSPRGTGGMGSLWDPSAPVQGMAGSAQALPRSAEFHLAGTNPAPAAPAGPFPWLLPSLGALRQPLAGPAQPFKAPLPLSFLCRQQDPTPGLLPPALRRASTAEGAGAMPREEAVRWTGRRQGPEG